MSNLNKEDLYLQPNYNLKHRTRLPTEIKKETLQSLIHKPLEIDGNL